MEHYGQRETPREHIPYFAGGGDPEGTESGVLKLRRARLPFIAGYLKFPQKTETCECYNVFPHLYNINLYKAADLYILKIHRNYFFNRHSCRQTGTKQTSILKD